MTELMRTVVTVISQSTFMERFPYIPYRYL